MTTLGKCRCTSAAAFILAPVCIASVVGLVPCSSAYIPDPFVTGVTARRIYEAWTAVLRSYSRYVATYVYAAWHPFFCERRPGGWCVHAERHLSRALSRTVLEIRHNNH